MLLARKITLGRIGRLFFWIALTSLLTYLLSPAPAQAATITVNTLADTVNVSGQCSLRDAIQHANTDSKFYANSSCPAGSGHDTITFSVSGTIKLGSALNTNTPITIQGPIILSGDEATRLFNVGNSGNLTLVNLTVRDGRFLNRVGSRGSGPGEWSAPQNIGVDGDGRLYIGKWRGIHVYDSNARFLDTIPTDAYVMDLAISDNNDIWAIVGHQLARFALQR